MKNNQPMESYYRTMHENDQKRILENKFWCIQFNTKKVFNNQSSKWTRIKLKKYLNLEFYVDLDVKVRFL